ncbi:MAG: WD40 repeat domain-containing protein, partial [Phycisphaerales bacterium JB040]
CQREAPDERAGPGVHGEGGRIGEPGEDTGPPWGPVRLGSLLPRAFVLSEDASTAYAGLPDSTALAVDTRTGTLIRGFPLTGTSVIDLHIDPERSRLMASLDDGRIVAFSEQQSPLAFTGHLGAVNPLAITPDGSRLVSGSWDGTVRVWDTGSGSALHTARVSYPNGAPAAVLELAMSPDGSECAVIATSAFDRPVMTCRIALDTGAISGVAVASKVGRASARYAPDGTPHLFGSVFDLPPENTTLRALPNTPFGFTRPVSQNPERFAHGVPGGGIAIRDIRTGEELAAFTHQAAQLGVIALSPDANAVALGDFRAQVEVVDARDGRPIGTLDGHSGGVLGVAWSPDGTRIATASRDGTVGIWDAKTYRLLVRLNGHSDYVFDVVWSPDGRTLYSSSGDGSVRVWRADRPETR